jgi:hypothetical protein
VDVVHTCPVAWAEKHGLLEGSPVQTHWCLSYKRQLLSELSGPDARDPALRLWDEAPQSLYYAPWDWVNVDAKVMLVGITPGAYQASEALREARRCIEADLSNEELLRRADAVGSFSGPMRTNLVAMLDGIGLAEALGIESTARLFDSHHHLAAHVSAIDFPLFVNDRNCGGANPPLCTHPVLRSLVKASLGPRVAMAGQALVVPLGKAAQQAIQLLIDEGLLDQRRCLLGMPHPSGANGWRVRHYAARREELTSAVEAWSHSLD